MGCEKCTAAAGVPQLCVGGGHGLHASQINQTWPSLQLAQAAPQGRQPAQGAGAVALLSQIEPSLLRLAVVLAEERQ